MKRFAVAAAVAALSCAAAFGQTTSGSPQNGEESTPTISSAQLQTIAAFAASYSPDVFTRERKGAFEVLPISESRAWSLTGTGVSSLSGVMDSKQLRLALTVRGGFSETVSYFFYVFPRRAAGKENLLTLEIQPRANGSRGACLLWEKGAAAPQLIGTVTTTQTSVELDIDVDQLHSAVMSKTGDAATIDFTAGWFDKSLGTWEEFYYSTFSTTDIPATG